MKCSLGISNFLEKISSLSHSVVFFYFFALIAEEGFLISSCYSLELCVQMLISFLFSLAFCFCSFLISSNPKESQPGKTDADAEAPVLWPPDVKSWLIGKDPAAGKDWRREENEEEMVGWHHRLRGHEFEQTLEIVENVGAWWTTVRGGCNRVGHDLMSKQQQQVHRTCEWVYNHSVFLTPFKKVTSGEDIGVWTHHWRVDFCRN